MTAPRTSLIIISEAGIMIIIIREMAGQFQPALNWVLHSIESVYKLPVYIFVMPEARPCSQ
jgi:hypothetical protein